jgi:hypothetical protein
MTISRRELLRFAGLVGAATVTSCIGRSTTPPDQPSRPLPYTGPEVYRGPIRGFEGLPLVPSELIAQSIEALRGKHPFLTKIATDLSTVTTASSRPKELPTYLSPKSFPLPIVVSPTESTFQSHVDNQPTGSALMTNPQGGSVEFPLIGSVTYGVSLGLTPDQIKANPLVAGLHLALEWSAIAYDLSTQKELYNLFSSSGVSLTEVDRRSITNSYRQDLVGASLFYYLITQNQAINLNSLTLPDFMVTSSAILIGQDLTSPNYSLLAPSVSVMSEHRSDGSLNQLFSIMDSWINSGNILPPPLAVSSPLSDARSQLYNLKKTPSTPSV